MFVALSKFLGFIDGDILKYFESIIQIPIDLLHNRDVSLMKSISYDFNI